MGMVCTTALAAVARNPTINRLASGPMETGRLRTGLYSEIAGTAAAENPTQAQAPSATISFPTMQRILFGLISRRIA
jgi:hypothetical protein